jgi:hypothetical protein
VKIPLSKSHYMGLVQEFSWETPYIKKKRRYVRPGGGFTLPVPPPIKYSLTGFNWGIQANFRDLEIILIPTGVAKAAGGAPGA